MRGKLWLVGLATVLAVGASAQKKVLDASVYDGWKSIRSAVLTNDGHWVAYVTAPQVGDAILDVKSTDGAKSYQIERVSVFRFTDDGSTLVATVIPKNADSQKAKRDKVKPEELPKNSLVILNLKTGQQTVKDRVTSFTLPDQDKGWLMYRPEPAKAEPAKPDAPKPEPAKADGPKLKPDHRPGEIRILLNVNTNAEVTLTDVVNARFNKSGEVAVYTTSSKDGSSDGVYVRNLASGKVDPVTTGMGHYSMPAISNDGSRVAFLTDKDDYASKKPSFALYSAKVGSPGALVAKEGSAGVPKGWWIAESGVVSMSESGNRIFFKTQPKPIEEKKDDTPDDEKVSVDIWSWTDPLIMPQQLLQAAAERAKSYTALADGKRVLQLENEDMESVTVGAKGDGNFAIGRSNKPYRQAISWGRDFVDYSVVDLRTGQATLFRPKMEGSVLLSPTGKFAYGYDAASQDIFAVDLESNQTAHLGRGITEKLWNEEFDNPDFPPLYGFGGWEEGDKGVVLYDKFDAWLTDPTGKAAARRITDGRPEHRIMRIQDLDPDSDHLAPTLFMTAMDDLTKASGFYRVDLKSGASTRLIWDNKRFGVMAKAKNSDRLAISRQDFVEYPDLWLTDLSLTNPKKVSDTNPQQKDYNWGKAELVSWRSNDGDELQGILIKPENFEYGKKYPLISYFYERDSDTLHQYRPPAPSASTINLPMYASNGYLIFIPDIPYKEGYPGESAVSAITSGVNSIVARGYVDTKHMGIQGQSWGGYQVGYLVTETNMFAAACAGAPVSDMISAYDGIRWGSGLLRQMQYERGQSRIAGTPWDKPLRFIENSPIFFADKVKTPLLIMSNDKDGSVPWYQGIEYFSALRRLGKPSWMVVYNGEDHNLVERKNRKDWSIRMQQFFDHYLKDAPAPRWMTEGVPATEKGKTFGFELPKGKG